MLITSLVMSLNQLLPVAILLILLQVIAKQSLLRLLGMLVLGIGLTFLFVKKSCANKKKQIYIYYCLH